MLKFKCKILYQIINLACLGLLFTLLLLFIFPVNISATHAAETTQAASDNSMLSVSAAATSTLDITPTNDGAASISNNIVHVRAEGLQQYSVTVAPVNNLTFTASFPDATIEPITNEPLSVNSFPVNSWGISLTKTKTDSETLFYRPTLDGLTLEVADPPLLSDIYYDIALKVDASLPAGEYTNTILISVVGEPHKNKLPPLTPGFSSISYMQDMTSAVCAAANIHETKQLTDRRDKNTYWITKLADGNCWMTQNLTLNINGAVNITPADSDVTKQWYGSTTYSEMPNASASSATTDYSWDLGRYVLATPLASKSCADTYVATNCESAGLVNVSSAAWKPTFTAAPGSWNFGDGTTEQELVAVDLNNHTYDPHYLIGNYYQFNAATAGTGGTLQNTFAPSSICPLGWKLPSNTQFAYLLLQYGITSSVEGAEVYDENGLTYNIAKPPLSFVRSGHITRATTTSRPNWRSAGAMGMLYSGGRYANNAAYLMRFTGAGVNTHLHNYADSLNAMPIRCVAK